MKRIIKTKSPSELQRWIRNQQRLKLNLSYSTMPSQLKEKVLKSLLKEQGGICCYTGIRITSTTSHIEHLKPQSISRVNNDNDDVNYNNLLAAYPHPDPVSPDSLNCPFGAHKKADWYDENLFVHPLQADCEERFIFDLEGNIKEKPGDTAAEKTLTQLELKHKKLIAMRKQAIDELLFSRRLSEAQINELTESIMQKDSNGNFRAFCFVLAQACRLYLRKIERSRIRRTSIHRQNQD